MKSVWLQFGNVLRWSAKTQNLPFSILAILSLLSLASRLIMVLR